MAKPLKSALKVFAVTFLVLTGVGLVFPFVVGGATGLAAVASFAAQAAALSAVGVLVGGLLSKGVEASRDNFGTKVSTRNATAPRQIVYGQCRVGGTITHIETLGSENEKLTMVVALAGHEIESLEKVFINDEELETTTSGGFKYATNQKFINSDNDNAFSGGYLLRYRFLDGSQTTGDSTIANNSSLTTNDKFIGVAIVFIQIIFDSEAFGGGIPPMAFVIKGKKVYDPREAGHTFGTESTYEWSDNPALHVLDFITNTDYGLKATADEFLETDTVGSFLQAANHCDVGNTITTATVNGAVTSSTSVVIDGASTNTLIDVGHSVTGTGISGTVKVVKRVSNTLTLSSAVSIADGVTLTFSEAAYTSNGFTNFSADGGGVIEGLLSSCAGKLSYINGKFVMFAGVNRSATLSINDDNLLAPIQITTKQTTGETFNSVKSIYVDANNKYVATDSPTYEDSTFLSEDTPSGESSANYKKVLELQLPFTDTNTMAQRLQKSALLHQRKQVSINILCNINFLKLQPNDWVYVTNERLSYTNKTFEVLSTNLEVIDSDGVQVLATRLALKEIDNTVYTFSSSNYNNPIDEGTSVSTGDFSVSAPTNLSVSATLINTGYDLNVQWTNIADDNIQGTEILYGTSSGTYTGSVITGKGVSKEIINNVKPNTTYYIVARHFSNNNVFSSYTSEETINTNSDSGITTPSAPTSLSATTGKPLSIGLSWTNPSNSDLRDIQIYRSTSSGFTPDDNSNLVRTIAGVPSVSQKVSFGIDDGLVAGTTYYFKVKAVSFFDKVSTASSEASGSFTKVEATDIEGIFSGYFHVEGSTTTALSDSAFNTAHGRLPIEDDILIMVNTSASPKVSKAYKYSGTAGSGGSFVEITNFTTGDLIAGETIAGNKLIANTITATQIDADTITATEIASNTITASQIASNTITATQIASSTITASEMNVSNLSSISADIGTITSGSLNIGSGAFTVSTAGVMTATGATVSGSITSTSGTIGGFTLGSTSLTAGSNTTRVSLSTADGIHLGNNTFSSAPFRVTRAGELTATNANVTGDLETGNLIVTGNAGIHGEVRATSLTAGTVTVASINQEVWNEIDARTAPTQNGFYDSYDSTSTGTYYNGVATNFELLGSGGNGYLSNGQSISIRTSMVHGYAQQGSQTYTNQSLIANFQFQYKALPNGNWTNFGDEYEGITSVYSIPNGFFYELDADPDASVSLSNGVYYQFRLRVFPEVTTNVWADSDAEDVFAIAFAIQQSSTGTGAGTGTVTSVGSGDGLSGGPITGSGTLTVDSTVVRTSGVQTVSGNKTFANNIVIQGNLDVQGTTTTVDSNDLNVKDKNITINYSTGDSSATANGAGITIQDAVDSSTDATILWDTSTDNFDFSHGITLPDNERVIIGTGSDLQIYHNGSHSFIANGGNGSLRLTNGTGNIELRASTVALQDNSAYNYLRTEDLGNGGRVRIYHEAVQVMMTESTGINVTGNIVVSGTVDGRDVATDGSKLDGIEAGATTDQTQSEINALGITAIGLSGSPNITVGTISSGAITSSGTGVFTGDVRIGSSITGDHALKVYHTNNYETAKFENSNLGSLARFTNSSSSIEIGNQSGEAVLRTGSTVRLAANSSGNVRIATGALQIGNTTVIDASRNLSNIGTITNSGQISSSGKLVFTDKGDYIQFGSGGTDISWTAPVIFRESAHLALSDYSGVKLGGFNGTAYGPRVHVKGDGNLSILEAGLQIGNTTVIDSSRNLTNIGTISSGAITSTGLNIDSGASDIAIIFDDDNVTNRYKFTTGGNSLDSFFDVNSGSSRASHVRTISGTVSFDITSGFSRNDINFQNADLFIKRSSTKALEIDHATGDISFYEDTGTTAKLFWDASAERLGIGTVSPSSLLHLKDNVISSGVAITVENEATSASFARLKLIANTETSDIFFDGSGGFISGGGLIYRTTTNRSHHFYTGTNNRMSIKSDGEVLVAKTSTDNTTAGHRFNPSGFVSHVRSSNEVMILNRLSNDGSILTFRKDGGNVGVIGTNGNELYIGTGDVGLKFDASANILEPFNTSTQELNDNFFDLGRSTNRFKNLHLSGTANVGEILADTGTTNRKAKLEDDGLYISRTTDGNYVNKVIADTNTNYMALHSRSQINFYLNSDLKATITDGGNLLVGTTDAQIYDDSLDEYGIVAGGSIGQLQISTNNNTSLYLNRQNANGTIIDFRVNGTQRGSIGTASDDLNINGGANHSGIRFQATGLYPLYNGTSANGTIDLGATGQKFKDLHLSGNANIGNNLDVSNDLTVQGVSTFDDSIQGQQGTSATFSEFHVGSNVAIGIEISNLTTTSAVQTSRTLGSASTYRTFKLLVQATSGTSYHATEILLTHDGTTVYMTEYGTIFTGNSLATFDADISSGNVRLLVDPNQSASTTFKFSLSAIKV